MLCLVPYTLGQTAGAFAMVPNANNFSDAFCCAITNKLTIDPTPVRFDNNDYAPPALL